MNARSSMHAEHSAQAHDQSQAPGSPRGRTAPHHFGPCHLAAVPVLVSHTFQDLGLAPPQVWLDQEPLLVSSRVPPPPEHRPKA